VVSEKFSLTWKLSYNNQKFRNGLYGKARTQLELVVETIRTKIPGPYLKRVGLKIQPPLLK